MKICTKSYLLLIALMLSFFSGMSTAADIEAGVVKRVIEIEDQIFSNFLEDNPIDNYEVSPEKSISDYSSINPKTIQSKAAANGITYFEIGHVGSSDVGWESISQNQFSTVHNHGGNLLYIYVWQIGLGNINNATMNAISKAPISSQPRCGSNLHVCSAGEIITGYLYLFNYSGQQGGNFSVSANSVANPFGFWSDSVYIQ